MASSPRFAAGISSLGFASAGEVEDDEEDEDKDEDEDEDEEREEEERVEVEDEEGAAAVEEPCASRRRLDGRSDAIQMFGWASGLKVIAGRSAERCESFEAGWPKFVTSPSHTNLP